MITKTQIAMHAFCLLLSLGALAVAGWALAAGYIHDLDGLFLLSVCLVFVLLFAILPVQALRAGLYRELLSRKKPAAEQTEDNTQLSQTVSQKS